MMDCSNLQRKLDILSIWSFGLLALSLVLAGAAIGILGISLLFQPESACTIPVG